MSINNITEHRFLKVVNEKYGTDLFTRFEKLDEEFQELINANVWNLHEDVLENEQEAIDHLKDEICDVYAVLTHIAGILGMNHKDMLDSVLDKIKGRETDPEYRRYKEA